MADPKPDGKRDYVYLRDRMEKWNDRLNAGIDLMWMTLFAPIGWVLLLARWLMARPVKAQDDKRSD